MFDFACNGRRSAAGLKHLVHQGYNRGIFQSDKNQKPYPQAGIGLIMLTVVFSQRLLAKNLI